MRALDSNYYDRWYTDVIKSSARDGIVQRALGLPPISSRRARSDGMR
jgi:hypothetical protein